MICWGDGRSAALLGQPYAGRPMICWGGGWSAAVRAAIARGHHLGPRTGGSDVARFERLSLVATTSDREWDREWVGRTTGTAVEVCERPRPILVTSAVGLPLNAAQADHF